MNDHLEVSLPSPWASTQWQLAARGSSFAERETFTETYNGKKVLCSCPDVSKLFNFCLPQMLESFKKEIDKLELTLGGDHWKGAFTFLACLIIRFTDHLRLWRS
jgi:hypothetical protein